MHMALRAPKGAVLPVDGKDVVPEVHAVLDAIAAFATAVRSGEWKVRRAWLARGEEVGGRGSATVTLWA